MNSNLKEEIIALIKKLPEDITIFRILDVKHQIVRLLHGSRILDFD